MIEKEFDQMLEDLDSANDEFVNDYFSDMNDLVFEKEEEEKAFAQEIEAEEEPETKVEEVPEVKPEVHDEEKKLDNDGYKNHFTSFSMTGMKKLRGNTFEIQHPEPVVEEKEEVKEEPKKTFSYNEILDRLDREKRYDLNNVNDLMKIIDKCDTSDEFFNYIESEANGK